jgi:hypothetical protein
MRLRLRVFFRPGKAFVSHVIIAAILFFGCTGKKIAIDEPLARRHIPLPAEVTTAIQKEFPGAMPYGIAIDTLIRQLRHYGIKPEDILWGQSTCVDDIINTKDKLANADIKGPFTFGGLAGLPFTGITGVDAFAHHVPDEGTALLFVGPHIGFTSGDGWGKILRHGQHHSSSCCGALYAALEKLKQGGIRTQKPADDDYQQQVLEQLAFQHREEILPAAEPLVTLTQVVSKEADRKITEYARKVRARHFNYAVLVVAVIINTDYQFDDYLWIDHVALKDIKADRWIETKRN